MFIQTFTVIPLVKFQTSSLKAKTMDKYCSFDTVLVIEIHPYSNSIQKPLACIELTLRRLV